MGVNKDHPKESIQKQCRSHHCKMSCHCLLLAETKRQSWNRESFKVEKKNGKISSISDWRLLTQGGRAGRLMESVWVAHFAFSDGY